jgi:2-polyprenyl-6-methoxyphenol hydroxylase-like FAD-dependent oxidoreductase
MRAVVIGAGVGGLTASIALQRAGAEVAVLERRADAGTLSEGGGMVIWHNALRALQSIDVDLDGIGVPLEEMQWRSSRNEPLGAWRVHELNERFGVDVRGVTRAALHPHLLSWVREGVVSAGAECVGYAQDGDGVVASLADGQSSRGDVLIAADGLNSVVRRQLRGTESARYAGYVIDFGVVDLEHPALVRGFREYDGPGTRLIYFPVAEGRWYWSSIYRRPARGFDAAGAPKDELLERYRGWPAPVEALIDATDTAATFGRDGLDRKPMTRWGDGRVTLLGDAAHPMTPNLGQGACQAIEDAVVLGSCVKPASDPVSALREYERRRIKRTAYAVRRSRLIGAVGRWQNPLGCWVRNKVQKRILPGVAFRDHCEWMGKEP